jgi:urease accessory protein
MLDLTPESLLRLQQLTSPVLPVGAYSYSEGLELLVETGTIANATALQSWLTHELTIGSQPLDGAIVCRAYQAITAAHPEQLVIWNQWWSAARETQELRSQSWQMGRSLARLLTTLDPTMQSWLEILPIQQSNWAIVFGAAAAHWQIDLRAALLAYFHGWVGNLIGAGVKLIPLGQTQGQQLLLELQRLIPSTTDRVMQLQDHDLRSCSWGLAIASSQHELQQVRLFQS